MRGVREGIGIASVSWVLARLLADAFTDGAAIVGFIIPAWCDSSRFIAVQVTAFNRVRFPSGDATISSLEIHQKDREIALQFRGLKAVPRTTFASKFSLTGRDFVA